MINIKKKYLEVNNKIYFYKDIKSIEFIENENTKENMVISTIFNLSMFGIIYITMIAIVFFITNTFTIILSLLGIIGILSTLIPQEKSYSIFIGTKEIYNTKDKEEFLKLKEKILENMKNEK